MKNMNKECVEKNGFTLVELLVVIGIIGILTAMATFNFNQSRERARDVQRKNDIKALQSALELYKNDNGQNFPSCDPELSGALCSDDDWLTNYEELSQELLSDGYVKDPINDAKEGVKAGSWENYSYYSEGVLEYYLGACLENKSDELFDAVGRHSDPVLNEKYGVDCALGSGTSGRLYIITEP